MKISQGRAWASFNLGMLCAQSVVLAGCGEENRVARGDTDTGILTGDVAFPEVSPDTVQFDTAPSDAAEDIDAAENCSVAPFGSGCPCAGAEDCRGYCVVLDAGRRCADTCVETCPTGFECVLADVGSSDPVFLCLPRFTKLCQPCNDHVDCQARGDAELSLCLEYGPAGKFCGAYCSADADCPEGYGCEAAERADGTATRQCRRLEGRCECNEYGEALGMSTTCSVTSGAVTCEGERRCGTQGLSECDAAAPAAEVCDSVDNDCNGQVDDIASDIGCVKSNEFGTCAGFVSCVGGRETCVGDLPEAEACNGLDDNCDGKVDEGYGDRDGDARSDCVDPDADGDGVVDTGDNCVEALNPEQADADGDGRGDACDADDDEDGTPDPVDCAPLNPRVHPGAAEVCNGDDDDCDAAVDEGLCDDDVACTRDRCNGQSGRCEHEAVDADCGDGNACTDDLCLVGIGCDNVPTSGGTCGDGDLCTSGDACLEGRCVGLPVLGCCSNDAGCDDGNPCTVDTCTVDSGACQHAVVANDSPCDSDANGCTRDDRCVAGVCVAGAAVQCGKETACATPGCVSTGANTSRCDVAYAGVGTGCDDGAFCSVADHCDGAGTCVGGGPKVCPFGAGGCRPGLCDEAADACGFGVAPDGVTCSDGNGCTVGDACAAGSCVPGDAPDCRAVADVCNDGTCSALDAGRFACVKAPKGAGVACEPVDFCIVGTTCDGAGRCGGGAPRDCTAEVGDQCNRGTCDNAGRRCVKGPLPVGTICDDGAECTLTDTCTNGVCNGVGEACAEEQISVGASGNVRPATVALGFGRYGVQWWLDMANTSQHLRYSDAYGSREGEEIDLGGTTRPAGWVARMDANAIGEHGLLEWSGATGVQISNECSVTRSATAQMRGSLFGFLGDPLAQGNLASVTMTAKSTSQFACNGYARFNGQRSAALAFDNGQFGYVASMNGDAFTITGSSLSPAPERVFFHPPAGQNAVGVRVTLVGEASTTGVFDARMTRNGSNRFVVAWVGDSGLEVLGARFDVAGVKDAANPWSLVTTAAGQTISEVRVGTFQSGRFVVAWEALGVDGSGLGVFFRRFDTDGTPLGDIVTVSTQRTGAQGVGDIGIFADESFVIVFDDANGDASGYAVKAQRYSDAGEAIGANMLINTLVSGAQYRPVVQVLADDEWVVAFVDDQSRVWTRRFRRDGRSVIGRPERRANEQTTGAQRFPAAARAPTGEVMIVWEGPGDGGTDVFARIVDDAGAPLVPAFMVNTTTSLDQGHPRVAASAEGFMVAWDSQSQDGSGLGVYARTFDAYGRPKSGEVLVPGSTAGDQHRPALAANSEGRFVIAWTNANNGNPDIYAAVVDFGGVVRAAEVRVNTTMQFAQDRASVTAFGNSGWVYVAFESMGGDGDGVGVLARAVAGDGTLPQGEFLLNTQTAGDQVAPTIASNADGTRTLACWESFNRDAPSTWGIYCQRFNMATLAKVGGEFSPHVVTAGDQLHPVISPLADGGFVIAWDSPNVDGAGLGIQMRRFDATATSIGARIVGNRTMAGDQSRPFIVPSIGGEVILGWQSMGQDGSDLGVYFRSLPVP